MERLSAVNTLPSFSKKGPLPADFLFVGSDSDHAEDGTSLLSLEPPSLSPLDTVGR